MYCKRDEFFKKIFNELNITKTNYLFDSIEIEQINKNIIDFNQSVESKTNEATNEIEQLLNLDDLNENEIKELNGDD